MEIIDDYIETGDPFEVMDKLKDAAELIGLGYIYLRVGRTNDPERRAEELHREYGIPENAIMFLLYKTSSVEHVMEVEKELHEFLCEIQKRCAFNYAHDSRGNYNEGENQYVYIVAWY